MRRFTTPISAAVRRLAAYVLVIAGSALIEPSRAADPQPNNVKLSPTGNDALDAALQGSSILISLQKTAPVGGFALTQRAQRDADRFETALRSFGYYKATVSTTIGGHALSDPTLPSTIDSAPADPPLEVAVSFDLGPRFKLGSVAISTPVPAAPIAPAPAKK